MDPLIKTEDFKDTFNNFGILKWEFREPIYKVDYLDLTFTLKRDFCITTKTYQKPMNLYLYL